MNRISIISLISILLLILGSAGVRAKGGTKVDVCHEPPGNPTNLHTLRISEKVLRAHLAHGDSTGSCADVYPDLVELQILAINDFHGNIATSSANFGGTGRADFLAANIQAAQEGNENSVFVSAGDLIGASPLISALFHDEPTIEAMNLIGLDINGVGHHEFDEGPTGR